MENSGLRFASVAGIAAAQLSLGAVPVTSGPSPSAYSELTTLSYVHNVAPSAAIPAARMIGAIKALGSNWATPPTWRRRAENERTAPICGRDRNPELTGMGNLHVLEKTAGAAILFISH
jgi:hypothetical protein